jgi:hypothetical protein
MVRCFTFAVLLLAVHSLAEGMESAQEETTLQDKSCLTPGGSLRTGVFFQQPFCVLNFYDASNADTDPCSDSESSVVVSARETMRQEESASYHTEGLVWPCARVSAPMCYAVEEIRDALSTKGVPVPEGATHVRVDCRDAWSRGHGLHSPVAAAGILVLLLAVVALCCWRLGRDSRPSRKTKYQLVTPFDIDWECHDFETLELGGDDTRDKVFIANRRI